MDSIRLLNNTAPESTLVARLRGHGIESVLPFLVGLGALLLNSSLGLDGEVDELDGGGRHCAYIMNRIA